MPHPPNLRVCRHAELIAEYERVVNKDKRQEKNREQITDSRRKKQLDEIRYQLRQKLLTEDEKI